ncbi:hypothetical protein J8631_00520 [Serratia fonticola]|uniref:hypothetical protein n=1 Tax=Serratia fonticola TaxID=47917 RepID=UPI001AE7673A|nr:hypothetical protein [Serratia fonticola]MBP1034037.1 hypothetical protein [Serratia fonticola]
MITGIEALALAATDILSASKAAQQIVSPLVRANSQLAQSSMPANPDEVKHALDRTLVAIASVDRKLVECTEIINALNAISDHEPLFTYEFTAELKVRAALLTNQIENLRDVFSLVETAPSWKPYLSAVIERKNKAIRSVSNLRNAYLNIALITEQFVSPVPTVESSVEGSIAEFKSAVASSNELLKLNRSEWR